MKEKHRVVLKDRINGNPDFAPLGHIGYTAMFNQVPDDVPGCPCGRAVTKEGAVLDLLRRINQRGEATYNRNDFILVDRSEGPG